ncbi:MAG: UDP-N-acetylmuramate dehydrogenase [Brooklawnia sp.]|jgi:UDP-N-acetylmuramate dehydrogenase
MTTFSYDPDVIGFATDLRDDTAVDTCTLERVSAELPDRQVNESLLLAEHTTFRVGGPARRLVHATTDDEVVQAVHEADRAGEPLLVLSGGSNVLIADEGFEGTVVMVDTHGLVGDVSECGGALVRVKAGENWDDFVSYTIDQEWSGIEALSGIPGLVGATPIQNVGAYGQEVSQTLARVRTWDRQLGEFRTFTGDKCGFGYRDSLFKRSREPEQATGRYVVLEVWYQFRLASLSEPVRYAQLASLLEVPVGKRVPAREVRQAVLELRSQKGMVLNPDDHDTWSAGSFFTNPIITAEEAAHLPSGAPRFAQPDGRIKTSAAWLIDHAGFPKGFPGTGQARLSTRHVLALTNRGQATASELADLARQLRAGVQDRYGIKLVPEPVLVGLSL